MDIDINTFVLKRIYTSFVFYMLVFVFFRFKAQFFQSSRMCFVLSLSLGTLFVVFKIYEFLSTRKTYSMKLFYTSQGPYMITDINMFLKKNFNIYCVLHISLCFCTFCVQFFELSRVCFVISFQFETILGSK